MAEDHDSWLAGIGVDVGRFVNSATETLEGAYETVKDKVLGNAKEGAGGAEGGASESSEGKSSEEEGTVKKLTFSKQVIPKIAGPKQHILGGRFEVEGEFEFTFEGTVELSQGEAEKTKPGAENEVALQYASKEFLLGYGKKWVNGDGLKIFNWNSIITEAGMSVTATIGEESKIAYEAEAKIGQGTVKFEAQLISYDAKKGDLKAGTLEFAGSVPISPGKVTVKKGIALDLKFLPTFIAKAEPAWTVIFEKDVAPKLKALGIESLEVAGMFVLAFGAPAAALKELVDIDDVNSAGQKASELTDALVEGQRLGFTGAPSPSDARMQQTYKAAYAKFDEQVKAMMQKNPGIGEAPVRKQLANAAAAEFEKQKGDIESQMAQSAQQATWDAYGNKYRDRSYDLGIVWTQLFGRLPKSDADVKKFMTYSKYPPPGK